MRLKSYFSSTVEAAMEMARKELGEDALLVNARPTDGTTRALGALEVVFGLPASDRTPAALLKARLARAENVDPPRAFMVKAAAASQRSSLNAPLLGGQHSARLIAPNPQAATAMASTLAHMQEEREKKAIPSLVKPSAVLQDDTLARNVAQLRSQVERILQALPPAGQALSPDKHAPPEFAQPLPLTGRAEAASFNLVSIAAAVAPPHPERQSLYRRLIESEIAPAIAQRVADENAEEDSKEDAEEALLDFINVAPTLGCGKAMHSAAGHEAGGQQPDGLEPHAAADPAAGPAIVALIGSPGAGKTTTLIKLAARYGLAARRPSHIVSIDVNRIAAADQLRVLAAILGIGCTVVETVSSLAQVIEEHRNKDFIFIDTPGFSPAEMSEAAELAAFLAGHPRIDTHLVLPASMRGCDMARMTDLYAIFSPGKLLFSKVDETDRRGALISESMRSRLPISFLSNGQMIPDDLQPASQQALAALVMRRSEVTAPRYFTGPQLAARELPQSRTGEPAGQQMKFEDSAAGRNSQARDPQARTAHDDYGNKPLKTRSAGAGA